MPRQLRIQYPGAMYHVMNRGDRQEAIFKDDQDHGHFLETLTEAFQKTEAGSEQLIFTSLRLSD